MVVRLEHSVPLVAESGDSEKATIWGLSVPELYDAFWRARGVQAIRLGKSSPIERGAEIFMLIEPGRLPLFDLAEIAQRLLWRNARVMRLRVVDEHIERYSEEVELDENGDVCAIERRYRPRQRGSFRVILTRSRRIASLWMHAEDARHGWDRIRRRVSWSSIDHHRCAGDCFHESIAVERRVCVNRLAERWTRPDCAIDGIHQDDRGVWSLEGTAPSRATVLIGPVFAGNGALYDPAELVIGPVWYPDRDPSPDGAGALVRPIHLVESTSAARDRSAPAMHGWANSFGKRVIDVVCAIAALAVVGPVLPVIALAILLEDRGPVLFAHTRQTRSGRPFRCWKFRTMVRDAQKMTEELEAENQADGPQFFIENDPRVTRVGRVLRRFHLDELPQLWNVLVGHMSFVGPRPSPDDENQYCPAWREARLSVRPGITGLWQLMRTRERDLDFQEWIRYDIEYVQTASPLNDLRIVVLTGWSILFGKPLNEASHH